MRVSVSSIAGLLALFAVLASTTSGQDGAMPEAGPPGEWHWLPEACLETLLVAPAEEEGAEESDEARWNRFYRQGIDAIGAEDLEGAEIAFCRALESAGSFAARDIRFAETLDELGLWIS